LGKKFQALNIENIEENRRRYREMLFTSPGLENYISGVILFSETVK
jgi:fructose-bisphosphate aldolase class I